MGKQLHCIKRTTGVIYPAVRIVSNHISLGINCSQIKQEERRFLLSNIVIHIYSL